jgi:hypothetical protein
VIYREHVDEDDAFLVRTDAGDASRIVLLAHHDSPDPDAETIRSILTIAGRIAERCRVARPTLGSTHVLIAEVLDESNVPAARAAAGTGSDIQAFAVPTEKLMALYFAIVLRRPGVVELLQELLTSHGHELYTHFFDTPGATGMGNPPEHIMDLLIELGLEAEQYPRVVPLGILVGPPAGDVGDLRALINPRSGVRGSVETPATLRGLIAVATTYDTMQAFADEVVRKLGDTEAGPEPDARVLSLAADLAAVPTAPTARVLVCGFRPGSVYMYEALMNAGEGTELLVLVHDEAGRREVLAALDAHSQLVARGMMPAHHGLFCRRDDGRIEYLPDGRATERPSVLRVAACDWSASRWLVELPFEFGHVAELDAIVFVASYTDDSDARVTKALLKLDRVLVHEHHAGGGRRPRVLAEVLDARLAARLDGQVGGHGEDVHVFSVEELRAFFLFQSVVVPGFDAVYAELLGSWGQSFVRLRPRATHHGPCCFTDLARALGRAGIVLVAIELRGGESGKLCVAPDEGDHGCRFELGDLESVWVVTDDDA